MVQYGEGIAFGAANINNTGAVELQADAIVLAWMEMDLALV